MEKKRELYSSLRHFDSGVRWSASRILLSYFLKGRKLPAGVLGMAFNIINGRAFDSSEAQNVRNASQDLLEKAIAAGIEKVVTIDNVIRDLADREPMVRILAIENLVISCEYDNDISKAIPQLVKALKDQDLGVRRNAAFAFLILSEHKYDLSGSRKALLEAVKDKDEKVKEYARKSTENLKSR
jgi:hypothetical protein